MIDVVAHGSMSFAGADDDVDVASHGDDDDDGDVDMMVPYQALLISIGNSRNAQPQNCVGIV